MSRPLFIIGARGSGKTTIGKALSKILKYAFFDTDDLICQLYGKSVKEIVEKEGWSGFRAKESTVLMNIDKKNSIISTGGGVVLSSDNRSFMRSNGIVLYLQTSELELSRRLKNSKKDELRPSLTGKSIIEEISEILKTRENLYKEVAHYIFDSKNEPDYMISIILRQLYPNSENF